MANTFIEIYADGSCSPNPGKGGFGIVMKYGDHIKEFKGSGVGTETNNTMELKAVIKALQLLTRRDIPVFVYTDSNYVVQGMTVWGINWKKNGFKGIKNKQLWIDLFQLAEQFEIGWEWVKGHNGHALNERADELANEGRLLNEQ